MPRWKKHLGIFIFILLWTLLVLYPRPADLSASIYRLFKPPTNPQAVEKLISLLPDREDPALVEKFILQEISYRYDWLNYNLPWYFPTAKEAMEKGTGDCKTRFIILASTLEALAIPYQPYISPSHIWADYEGKKENDTENEKAILLRRDGNRLRFERPEINWRENAQLFYEVYWRQMPLRKKITLLAGFIFAFYLYRCPFSLLRASL